MRIVTTAALAMTLLAFSACSPPLKEYDYPAWGFAVSFPSPPSATDKPASPDGSQPRSFQLEDKNASHDYVVAATDASASPKSDDEILSQVPDAIAQGVGGTVTSRTYVATVIGQVVGREALIDKPGQATMRVRIYVSGRRLYQVGAQSVLGPNDPGLVAFLDSFHLLGKPSSGT